MYLINYISQLILSLRSHNVLILISVGQDYRLVQSWWPGQERILSFGRVLILFWLLGHAASVLLIQLRMSSVWRLGLSALKWNLFCCCTSLLWRTRQERADSRQKSPKLFSLDLPFQSRVERVREEISRHIRLFAPEDKEKIQSKIEITLWYSAGFGR